MQLAATKRVAALAAPVALALAFNAQFAGAQNATAETCPGGNAGISLPKGFCATVFADNIGHARQMAVARTAPSTRIRGAASTTRTTICRRAASSSR